MNKQLAQATTGILFVLFLVCGNVAGITVNLDAAKDNTLYEDINGSLSNGAGPGMFVGQTGQSRIVRGLLMFEVAAEIPSSATVTSASITLQATTPQGTSTTPIDLWRVAQDWGEEDSIAAGFGGGGGGGGPALPGDATWTHRFTDTEAWTNPGGDFLSVVSATQGVGDVGSYKWSSSQLVSDIQDMLDNPNTNFGWILRGNELTSDGIKRFGTRESTDPPLLTIKYDLASSFAADFDGDNDVDGADLGDWKTAFGTNGGGDADSDNDSDGADFLVWQTEFTGPAGVQTVAVPEPSTAILALALLALATRNCRGNTPRS